MSEGTTSLPDKSLLEASSGEAVSVHYKDVLICKKRKALHLKTPYWFDIVLSGCNNNLAKMSLSEIVNRKVKNSSLNKLRYTKLPHL